MKEFNQKPQSLPHAIEDLEIIQDILQIKVNTYKGFKKTVEVYREMNSFLSKCYRILND